MKYFLFCPRPGQARPSVGRVVDCLFSILLPSRWRADCNSNIYTRHTTLHYLQVKITLYLKYFPRNCHGIKYSRSICSLTIWDFLCSEVTTDEPRSGLSLIVIFSFSHCFVGINGKYTLRH